MQLINQTYYKPLTGLRFVAALMVFFSHFPIAGLPQPVKEFVAQFQVGVPIFFVLSGYLICSRYYDAASYNKRWFRTYFVNRFARIYPMFFLITLLNVLYKNESIKIFLINITFLKGFFNDFVFTGIGQGWSITTEECFYFLAPLIFMLLRKGINIIWLCTCALAIGFVVVFIFKPLSLYGFFGDFGFMMVFTFFGRCVEFFTGVWLALYLKEKKLEQKKNAVVTYSGILGLMIVIFALSLVAKNESGLAFETMWIIIHNFLSPLPVALLLTGLIYENTFVSRLFSGNIMQLLGKSSYTFYLIHLGVFHKLFITNVAENIILLLVFITFLSIILYKCVEEPLNLYVRKKLSP
ncbi:MAG TPA: acyltransferase [Bacteroidia bacterium]|nr:acyltransferase [Bacteroidia bacterium]HNU34351.1 acyltransferase [Bacteroidia bacterium]